MKKVLLLVALVGLPVQAWAQPVSLTLSSALCPGTVANPGCVRMNVDRQGTAGIQIVGSGTWTAAFEVSIDGLNFQTIKASPSDGGVPSSTAIAAGLWTLPVAALSSIRVRVTDYTSGALLVHLTAAPGGGGGSAAGSTAVDNLPNTIGSTTVGSYGALTFGAASLAAPTYTAGQNHPISLDLTGAVRVNVTNGAAGGTSAADNANFADNTTSLTPIGGVMESASPTACSEGKLCMAALTPARSVHVTIFDASGNALTTPNDYTEDTAVTDASTGPAILTRRQDVPTGSSAGSTNDWAILNQNAAGALYTIPGGALAYYRTSAGSTEDEHEIKATAGVLYSVLVTNTNASARYIRCYNLTAANTTPGTSTVFWGAAIPGDTAGAGFAYSFPGGLYFDTALTCAFTTGAADTDVAEVAANEVKATYSYR